MTERNLILCSAKSHFMIHQSHFMLHQSHFMLEPTSNVDVSLIAVTPLEKKILEFANAVSVHPLPGLVELPALISLRLVGLKGVGILGNDGFSAGQILDEDQIAPEPVILHDLNELEGALKNFFDVIWQSFGAYGSPNYDEKGSRLPSVG